MTSRLFINLANDEACDTQIAKELLEAGVDLVFHTRRSTGEVPFSITGELQNKDLSFIRSWRYWIVKGYIHIATAREIFKNGFSKVVRAAGHCNDLDPELLAEPTVEELEYMAQKSNINYEIVKNYRYIKIYHIDTQEGLNYFVKLFKNK